MHRHGRAFRPLLFRCCLALLLLTPVGCSTRPPAQPETPPGVAVQDPEVADFLLVRAEAEAGSHHAQLLLAEKLLAGKGSERDRPQAHAWLEKAAEQEYAPALDLLATLHYRGVGVAVDYHKARALMERAVDRRYLPAINNLAWMLATCPDERVRDGRRAIALLEPVMDQSAQMLDTLAAAYAEVGDFERANALQKQAVIALRSVDDPRLDAFIMRMATYANGLPWRDPDPENAPADDPAASDPPGE